MKNLFLLLLMTLSITVSGQSIIGQWETYDDKTKDNPIRGLVIIENIKKIDKKFDGGTILDPESGETYSCYLELINKNKLKVRGFLGFSIFGRTQYWIRKE